MTYDNWKTTEPDTEPGDECSRCGRSYALGDIWLVGNDWVCGKCCETEEAADDE